MCGKKANVTAAPAAAAPVAAPLKIDNEAVDTGKAQTNPKAKGKKKLTINQVGTGTGVNI